MTWLKVWLLLTFFMSRFSIVPNNKNNENSKNKNNNNSNYYISITIVFIFIIKNNEKT